MPLPVRACSDEELKGYAPIDPAAAAELARRIAEGRAERDAALQEAQEEARSISGQYDDLEDRVEEFCRQMRKLITEAELLGDQEKKFIEALSDLEDYL